MGSEVKAWESFWDPKNGDDYEDYVIDRLYGYRKHVLVIIADFGRDYCKQNEVDWDFEEITETQVKRMTAKDARDHAFERLQRLAEITALDLFDTCVLPIKPRPHGRLPRAFLGSDLAWSREGLGYHENRLRHYLKHPNVVPKAKPLSWDDYNAAAPFSGYDKYFYSIKYDGYSAIWTGTKLVTANGRQPVITMSKEMQDALFLVPFPLVGELIAVTIDGGEQFTKESLQAVVHSGLSDTTSGVARRMVFMVYDTPSPLYAEETFSGRRKLLEEKLRNREGEVFTAEKNRVQLVQQYKVFEMRKKGQLTTSDVICNALYAATAAGLEGLMLTPDVKYMQLHSDKTRRVKVKPMFRFWTPVPESAKVAESLPRPVNKISFNYDDKARGIPRTFKLNIEGNVFVSTNKSIEVQLAKHRWGYHPIVHERCQPNVKSTGFEALVKPTGLALKAAEYKLTANALKRDRLIATEDQELHRLISARLINPEVISDSGRPHYLTLVKESFFDDYSGVVTRHTFRGEATTEEIINQVRKASILAERGNRGEKTYNEWLCMLHRAYSKPQDTAWPLEQPGSRQIIKLTPVQRVKIKPGESVAYYELDFTSAEGGEYHIYKLTRYDNAPNSGALYDSPQHGNVYYTVAENEQNLPYRVTSDEVKIEDSAGKTGRTLPANTEKLFVIRRKTAMLYELTDSIDSVLDNYALALTDAEYSQLKSYKGEEVQPTVVENPKWYKNQYTLLDYYGDGKYFMGKAVCPKVAGEDQYTFTTVPEATSKNTRGGSFSTLKIIGSSRGYIAERAVAPENTRVSLVNDPGLDKVTEEKCFWVTWEKDKRYTVKGSYIDAGKVYMGYRDPVAILDKQGTTAQELKTEEIDDAEFLLFLNTADKTTLRTVNGIDEALAGRIVTKRTAEGDFTTSASVTKIGGISERVYNKWKRQFIDKKLG